MQVLVHLLPVEVVQDTHFDVVTAYNNESLTKTIVLYVMTSLISYFHLQPAHSLLPGASTDHVLLL